MSVLTQQFWTSFGQYMAPVPSAEGVKVNWINYKTGIKNIHFTMQADNQLATITILLNHADPARQLFFYNQFRQVKNLLHDALQEDWTWALQVPGDNNSMVSKIYITLKGVNIFRKEDWPAIISFFKPRIIALDAFWTVAKFGFE